jgi:microcystin-dependent protein
MSEPYVGEIRMFGGNFAPSGWMYCEGQLLPISEYETLFNLIGTTYGGDGEQTFSLPDLRGRLPLHQGNGATLAEMGGVEQVTLNTNQIPTHTHPYMASTNTAGGVSPQNAVIGQSDSITLFRAQPANTAMSTQATTVTGNTQPHTNFQPYLCIHFIISLFGVFPTPT